MRKPIFIFLFALLGIFSAQAYNFKVGSIYYNYSRNGVEVTYGSGKYSGSVVIPSTVTYQGYSYRVTSIGSSAFSGCSLTSIMIPESVTSIGDGAFTARSLTSIMIPYLYIINI